MDLTRLLGPTSVAVVGATDRTGAYGAHVIANLVRAGFPGRVVGVHPTRSQVLGVPCIGGLEMLTEPVDAVVVATPAPTVPQILSAAGRLGCGGAVVFAAGFLEAGEAAAQDQLRRSAAEHGLPVIGPNANGLVSVAARAPLWGDAVTLPEPGGTVALVTQSGNIGVIGLAHRDGLGLHTVVSLGNAAVVDAAAVIAHLATVDDVRCIAAYLEDDGDGPRLAQALAACADTDTRVVILKAGRSPAGRAAGAAHTAALSGDHDAFRALAREAGAVLVDEPHTLLETARAIAGGRRHQGGLAVLTCSGGDAAIAGDLAADLDVALAPLEDATRSRLQGLLPYTATVSNPLDHTNLVWADVSALQRIGAVLASDPGVGHVVYVQDQPPGLPASDAEEWRLTRDGALAGARAAGAQPILAATTPGQEPPGAVSGLRAALTAVGALRGEPADAQRLRAVALVARTVRERSAEPGSCGPRSESGVWLAEHEGKALLRAAGVQVPTAELVPLDEMADAAVVTAVCETADRIGGPVAIKISAAGLLHKSDAGAVVVALSGRRSLAAAARRLVAAHRARPWPGAVLLVEAMAPGAVEIFVAARSTGIVPTLALGLGGVWAEMLEDVVTVALPIDPDVALAALRRLRAYPALTAGRGGRPSGWEDLAHLACRVAALVVERPLQLVELNPVLVGSRATAVDAVLRLEAGWSLQDALDGFETRP